MIVTYDENDKLPIDSEWLLSIGFELDKSPAHTEPTLFCGANCDDDDCDVPIEIFYGIDTGTWRFCTGSIDVILPTPKNRGEARLLLLALKADVTI